MNNALRLRHTLQEARIIRLQHNAFVFSWYYLLKVSLISALIYEQRIAA